MIVNPRGCSSQFSTPRQRPTTRGRYHKSKSSVYDKSMKTHLFFTDECVASITNFHCLSLDISNWKARKILIEYFKFLTDMNKIV